MTLNPKPSGHSTAEKGPQEQHNPKPSTQWTWYCRKRPSRKNITLNPKPSGHGTAERGPQEKITLNPKPSSGHCTAEKGPQEQNNPKP